MNFFEHGFALQSVCTVQCTVQCADFGILQISCFKIHKSMLILKELQSNSYKNKSANTCTTSQIFLYDPLNHQSILLLPMASAMRINQIPFCAYTRTQVAKWPYNTVFAINDDVTQTSHLFFLPTTYRHDCLYTIWSHTFNSLQLSYSKNDNRLFLSC